MFNYESIPKGYYDQVLHGKRGIRRAWHELKFLRVISLLPLQAKRILDVGCFSGSLLGMIPQDTFPEQVGIDILPNQIEYANEAYGNSGRKFLAFKEIEEYHPTEKFDCILLVEVIEHLSSAQIKTLLTHLHELLEPGGELILTTPNYLSFWPFVELLLNRLSDVSYEEQHLTKFNFFGFESRLNKIDPAILQNFTVDLKTTSHFIAPFLAGFSYNLALGSAEKVDPDRWKFPFGQLLLVKLKKRI